MSTNQRFSKLHERLRLLRSLTGLTRPTIEEKYGLPEITLRKWETGQFPISNKGIKRCINIYQAEGIIVNEDWIIKGTGPFPTFVHINEKKNSCTIDEDLAYFEKKYPNCTIYQVVNNEMLPFYDLGDIVIGFMNTNQIKQLHLQDCIILLENNNLIFRRLIVNDDSFNLLCTNPLITDNPVLFNAKIKSVAPIIWHKLARNNNIVGGKHI